MTMTTKIKYRDAYGQQAVAIRAKYGHQWRLTLVHGLFSYTRTCDGLPHVKRILNQHGYGWTEVGRW